MFTAASQSKTMVIFLYLPQTRCHAPAKAHRPLQPALGPPLAATVPTCNTQTIGAQCSMLLWSRCSPPPSLNPNSSPSGWVYHSGKEQLRWLAGWKSPKGFSVPSSLGEAKAEREC